MLKQRVLTALALIPVALAGFFWLNGGAFALFIGAVVVLGGWEWARLAGIESQPLRWGYAAVVALGLGLCWVLPGAAHGVLLLALAWWLYATVLVLTYPDSAKSWQSAWRRLLIGLVVLVPAWQGLMLLKAAPGGNLLILTVMVLVWLADIFAYFSGRAFGRRKLAPAVSPGKSWEGLYGGLAAALVATLILGSVKGWGAVFLGQALLGAALVVLFSIVGDLTESMFKRQAGLKDSSGLLPGHGGVLDRIDSLTAAVPLFALLLWWAGWGVQ